MMKLLKTLAHSFLSLFLSECFVHLMMFFDSEMLAIVIVCLMMLMDFFCSDVDDFDVAL